MHQKVKIIRSGDLDDLEKETNIFISERAGHIYAVKLSTNNRPSTTFVPTEYIMTISYLPNESKE